MHVCGHVRHWRIGSADRGLDSMMHATAVTQMPRILQRPKSMRNIPLTRSATREFAGGPALRPAADPGAAASAAFRRRRRLRRCRLARLNIGGARGLRMSRTRRPHRPASGIGYRRDAAHPPAFDHAGNGADDPNIAGTAAQIAAHRDANFLLVCAIGPHDQIAGGNQHSRRAIAALQRVLARERADAALR